MKILIVDDDFLELESIKTHLSEEFPNVVIQTIETESGFRRAIPALRASPPNLVILDMLLRWTDIKEEMPLKGLEGGLLPCRYTMSGAIGVIFRDKGHSGHLLQYAGTF
jgi:DNA-binding NarL/FixJ family response regulator